MNLADAQEASGSGTLFVFSHFSSFTARIIAILPSSFYLSSSRLRAKYTSFPHTCMAWCTSSFGRHVSSISISMRYSAMFTVGRNDTSAKVLPRAPPFFLLFSPHPRYPVAPASLGISLFSWAFNKIFLPTTCFVRSMSSLFRTVVHVIKTHDTKKKKMAAMHVRKQQQAGLSLEFRLILVRMPSNI